MRDPGLPEGRPAAHTWPLSAWGAVSAELRGNKWTSFHQRPNFYLIASKDLMSLPAFIVIEQCFYFGRRMNMNENPVQVPSALLRKQPLCSTTRE